MTPVSDAELNEQALQAATTAISESVVAATICEQTTDEMMMGAAGIGKGTQTMAKFGKKLGRGVMPGVGGMAKGLESGGLPKSFILAVTKTKIYALEDKRDGDKLVAGKEIKSWDREGFRASAGGIGGQAMGAISGIPDDKQSLTLYLPLDGSKNKYLAASANMQAAAGSPGQPTKFMVGKDPASEAVIREIANSAGPTMIVGGQIVGGMPGQAAPDSTDKLEKLAALRDSGALTDAEFEAQKAKIIGS